MKRSLTRLERLRGRTDIGRLFSSTGSLTVSGMRLLFCRNSVAYNRILVTLTRKYGNAVQRNRAKRVLRDIYRNIKHELKTGFDIGFIVYPGEFNYENRLMQCRSLLMKAGIFK